MKKNTCAVAAALGTMLLRGFTFTYRLYVSKHFLYSLCSELLITCGDFFCHAIVSDQELLPDQSLYTLQIVD
jgi:hypothetical protein